jgi:hypothetical protein
MLQPLTEAGSWQTEFRDNNEDKHTQKRGGNRLPAAHSKHKPSDTKSSGADLMHQPLIGSF